MNRSDLSSRLAAHFPQLSLRDAEASVDVILTAMTRQLVGGGRVEVRGFGAFATVERPARIGRNPKSGARVEVPDKRRVHFKPGKQLRESVDHLA